MEGRQGIAVGIAPTEQPAGGREAGVGLFRAEEATAAAKEYTSSTPSPSTSPTPSPPSAAAGHGGSTASGGAAPPGMPPPWTMGSEGSMEERGGKPSELAADGSRGNHGTQMTLSHANLSSGRRRGRPRGSGRRQILATLGEWYALSAGGSFTPHVLTIAAGEDVAARVMSFSQKGPRSVCILSANGAISNVTLRQPGSSGSTFTYEGRFEILQLSGSFTIAEEGNGRRRSGGLSVSLAGPDGRVVGGGVAGLLRAASPIQVVVGSFLPNSLKQHKRRASLQESSTVTALPAPTATGHVLTAAMPISQAAPDNGCQTPVSAAAPAPVVHGNVENSTSSAMNSSPAGFMMVGWPVISQSRGHKPSPDINVCLMPQE